MSICFLFLFPFTSPHKPLQHYLHHAFLFLLLTPTTSHALHHNHRASKAGHSKILANTAATSWHQMFVKPLLLLLAPAATPALGLRVAIVGAGVGGAASAYYLRELLGDSASITVFEESVRVGGRVENVSYTNATGATVPLEIGASILHSGNNHLVTAIDKLKLHAGPPVFDSDDGTTGIWDGNRLVFQSSPWSLVTAFRVLWRYGWGMFKLRRVVRATLDKFTQIYVLQNGTLSGSSSSNGLAFETPEALWEALGLFDLTQLSIRDYLAAQGVGAPDSKLVTEFVGSIQRVNYNSNNDINALAGLVSLCPIVTGEVVSVKEGNAAMAVAMIQAAEARLVLNVTVRLVQIMGGGGEGTKKSYRLLREDGQPVLVRHENENEEEEGDFNAVIIATPFAFSKLAVLGLDKQSVITDLPPKQFTDTHATFIQGRVRPGFFGPSTLQQHRIPSSVYVVENASVPISSLSLHITLNATDGTGIYKLFSSALLEDSFVDSVFSSGWEELHHREWLAYPSYHPPEQMTPFLVQPGERICYVNALETAVSAMEISAIAARNCALLLVESLGLEGRGKEKMSMEGHAEEKEDL